MCIWASSQGRMQASPPAWAPSGAAKSQPAKLCPADPSKLPVTTAISQKRMAESVLGCPILRATDTTRHRQPGDQQHDEDNHEDEEQGLGDGDRSAGDCRETQKARDQADNQENQGPTQHRTTPSQIRFGNAGATKAVPRAKSVPSANCGMTPLRLIRTGSSGA